MNHVPRFTVGALFVLAGIACGASSATDAGAIACEQSGEFGSYGCGDVAGRVVGTSGAGVRDAYVVVFTDGSSAGGSSLSGLARTDSDGRYTVRASWLFPGARPNDVAVWVRATVQLAGTATVSDSVRVVARLRDVGQAAAKVDAPTITVAVP
ncbi:MAG: hypothetical protein V4550_10780 [Gemmatimonadota bacterium]